MVEAYQLLISIEHEAKAARIILAMASSVACTPVALGSSYPHVYLGRASTVLWALWAGSQSSRWFQDVEVKAKYHGDRLTALLAIMNPHGTLSTWLFPF